MESIGSVLGLKWPKAGAGNRTVCADLLAGARTTLAAARGIAYGRKGLPCGRKDLLAGASNSKPLWAQEVLLVAVKDPVPAYSLLFRVVLIYGLFV